LGAEIAGDESEEISGKRHDLRVGKTAFPQLLISPLRQFSAISLSIRQDGADARGDASILLWGHLCQAPVIRVVSMVRPLVVEVSSISPRCSLPFKKGAGTRAWFDYFRSEP
jgi:hypothetical protein